MVDHRDHAESVQFVSLGMLVLDELRLPHGDTRHDVLGGSGAYAMLGARLATPRSRAHDVGCFVLAGHDFPDAVLVRVRRLDVVVEVVVVAPARPSTRGLLEYHDAAFNHKTFRYLNPPLRPSPSMLPAHLLTARAFHWLLPPGDVVVQIEELLLLRRQAGVFERPLFVWEPFPAECQLAFLDRHLEACGLVDVFSPNHLELLGLFGEPAAPEGPEGAPSLDQGVVEACAGKLLDAMTAAGPPLSRHPRAVVVRAAEHGSFLASAPRSLWLPPVHADAGEVVDATGGGNAFLGAFTVALERSGDLVQACAHGHVAASFAIEQIGFPTLRTDGEEDLWNDDSFTRRLADLYGVSRSGQ